MAELTGSKCNTISFNITAGKIKACMWIFSFKREINMRLQFKNGRKLHGGWRLLITVSQKLEKQTVVP